LHTPLKKGGSLKALITGATGLVGTYLARALLRRGASVRILARTAERAEGLRQAGASVHVGDLVSPGRLCGITEGVDTVFHLASAMRGRAADLQPVDVRGTEWLLGESQRTGTARFVYAGTLAAYPPGTTPGCSVVDERTPLDDSGLLGEYARAKVQCENLIHAATAAGKMQCVIVRLGWVCGIGADLFPPHVCVRLARNWVALFGDGRIPLPLTLADNAAAALVLAAETPGIGGETFNIVDDEVLTQRDYLELVKRHNDGRPRVLRLPRAAYYGLALTAELAGWLRGKPPQTTRYRIRSRLARVQWDCSKAKGMLHWQPASGLREGLAPTLRMHSSDESQGLGRAAH